LPHRGTEYSSTRRRLRASGRNFSGSTGRADRLAALGEAAYYADLELSPDGTRAAVSVLDPVRGTRDLWLYEVAGDVRTRFTFDPANERYAIWSRDGSRIAFGSDRRGVLNVYQKPSSGAGGEELLVEADVSHNANTWSPDGRLLLHSSLGRPYIVWMLRLDEEPKPVPLLRKPFYVV